MKIHEALLMSNSNLNDQLNASGKLFLANVKYPYAIYNLCKTFCSQCRKCMKCELKN